MRTSWKWDFLILKIKLEWEVGEGGKEVFRCCEVGVWRWWNSGSLLLNRVIQRERAWKRRDRCLDILAVGWVFMSHH